VWVWGVGKLRGEGWQWWSSSWWGGGGGAAGGRAVQGFGSIQVGGVGHGWVEGWQTWTLLHARQWR
jgi:hypothetical protein